MKKWVYFTCHNWALIYDSSLEVLSKINTEYNNFRAMEKTDLASGQNIVQKFYLSFH